MNIDFLKSKDGDFGLVSTGRFDAPISGVIFDHESLTLSLEFDETVESMTLNVALDPAYAEELSQKGQLFIIGTDKKHIYEAYSTPLMHVNDLKITDGGWA